MAAEWWALAAGLFGLALGAAIGYAWGHGAGQLKAWREANALNEEAFRRQAETWGWWRR